MTPKDVKIEVTTKDTDDGCHIAIVLGLSPNDGWYNTGIVIRDPNPHYAFCKAVARAEEEGYWTL